MAKENNTEKSYYYPIGPNRKKKYHYPLSTLLKRTIQLFMCRGYEIIGEENIPDEPCFICATHSKLWGPMVLDKLHKRQKRVWSNANLILADTFGKHIVSNVLPDRKGFKYHGLNFLAHLLSYPAANMLRSFDPIPVYLDTRVLTTFKKSAQTLRDGKDVIMFPEWKTKVPEYQFVNQVKGGIAIAIKQCLIENKKPVPLVPVYVCPALRKIIYGKVMWVENTKNYKQQTADIIKHIMDEIECAGRSLPPHKFVPYSEDSYTKEEKALIKQRKAEELEKQKNK